MTTYNCFRLFDFNYIDEDILANSDVSSENASFPVDNAFNFERRSKVWRSQGYFKITSSNNTIIFRETSGVPLTATITVAEYTSISALSTAIKTAMDAAGVSTYTVLNDSTTGFRFKITSNGVGGGGIFELDTDNASFTAYDVLGFDNSAEKTGALNYTADYIRIHTEEFILFDLGVSTNPSSFIMIGDKSKDMQISPNATIKLQGNHTNNFSSPAYDQALTYDIDTISEFSNAGLASAAYRYWRLSILDRENPEGYVEVGCFYLGRYWNPQRGSAQYPLKTDYVDRSVTVFAESGPSFTDLKSKTRVHRVRWFGLEKEDVEEFYNGLWERNGLGKPFFVAMDINNNFSTNQSVIYCKFEREPSVELISNPDTYGIEILLREEL